MIVGGHVSRSVNKSKRKFDSEADAGKKHGSDSKIKPVPDYLNSELHRDKRANKKSDQYTPQG